MGAGRSLDRMPLDVHNRLVQSTTDRTPITRLALVAPSSTFNRERFDAGLALLGASLQLEPGVSLQTRTLL